MPMYMVKLSTLFIGVGIEENIIYVDTDVVRVKEFLNAFTFDPAYQKVVIGTINKIPSNADEIVYISRQVFIKSKQEGINNDN